MVYKSTREAMREINLWVINAENAISMLKHYCANLELQVSELETHLLRDRTEYLEQCQVITGLRTRLTELERERAGRKWHSY